MDLAMSALPLEADIRAGLQDVCFVPTSDMSGLTPEFCLAAQGTTVEALAGPLATASH
jgi:hypothetical protein